MFFKKLHYTFPLSGNIDKYLRYPQFEHPTRSFTRSAPSRTTTAPSIEKHTPLEIT